MKIIKLVLLRHGESQWNQENRFTGWTDVELSHKGRSEAKQAGKILKAKGFQFDFSYTSMLKRAIHTLWMVLDELNQAWIPVEKSWYLNERHYGALQGLNKTETAKKYGEEQVQQWRRSYTAIPPSLADDDIRLPSNDLRYTKISANALPNTESLSLTLKRVIYYWNNTIIKRIKNSERIIIVAHGNSIRAMVKFLDNINDNEIMKLDIPTGIPLIYEFNDNLNAIRSYYLNNA